MNRNNLSVGIRLVCFVLSDTIHIKGGPPVGGGGFFFF